MDQWQQELDFLAVGSGAAGMTAAITAHKMGLSSMVIEKSAAYGGTTALSGGVLWLPNHHMMKSSGIQDSEQEAMTYLNQVVSDDVTAQRLTAFVKKGPEMLKFLHDNSLVRYTPAKEYPDYYAELPGGKQGARSVDPVPYSIRALGETLFSELRALKKDRQSFAMTAHEAHIVFSFTWKSTFLIFKRMASFLIDIPFRKRNMPDNRLTLGRALIARLRKTMANENIPLLLNTSAEKIIIENNEVVGVECLKDGAPWRIKINKGLLLATGGFAHNAQMRAEHHRFADHAKWTAASSTDTGEGILMAQQAGAATGMMDYAWWTPTLVYPDGGREAFIVGKSMPYSMVVNKRGERFCNEAEPYEDFVKHQLASSDNVEEAIPSYFIFDARYRHEYPVGMKIPPGKFVKDDKFQEFFDNGWIKKANTLAELAVACGIDAQGLEASAASLATFSATGKDTDFNRGDYLTDVYYSDHRVKPNPCLAPIADAPFYAIELWPGDLGTKGGVLSDEHANVLNAQQQAIKGFYASGNVAAPVMGDSYPAAGATLGPAMTFAYIAAQHAAEQ